MAADSKDSSDTSSKSPSEAPPKSLGETPAKSKTTKFAATLTELEQALQAWDEAVTQQPTAPAAQVNAPLYETKLIKELCKQLRELSKE